MSAFSLSSAVQRSSLEDPRDVLKFGRKGTNQFLGQKELSGRSLGYATLAPLRPWTKSQAEGAPLPTRLKNALKA
jgi:hypothetical protein